jgi:hypothetical protein
MSPTETAGWALSSRSSLTVGPFGQCIDSEGGRAGFAVFGFKGKQRCALHVHSVILIRGAETYHRLQRDGASHRRKYDR